MRDRQSIENAFKYHQADPVQQAIMADIREKLLAVALMIHENTPASREQSLALTHLEQAGFYANAAIVRN